MNILIDCFFLIGMLCYPVINAPVPSALYAKDFGLNPGTLMDTSKLIEFFHKAIETDKKAVFNDSKLPYIWPSQLAINLYGKIIIEGESSEVYHISNLPANIKPISLANFEQGNIPTQGIYVVSSLTSDHNFGGGFLYDEIPWQPQKKVMIGSLIKVNEITDVINNGEGLKFFDSFEIRNMKFKNFTNLFSISGNRPDRKIVLENLAFENVQRVFAKEKSGGGNGALFPLLNMDNAKHGQYAIEDIKIKNIIGRSIHQSFLWALPKTKRITIEKILFEDCPYAITLLDLNHVRVRNQEIRTVPQKLIKLNGIKIINCANYDKVANSDNRYLIKVGENALLKNVRLVNNTGIQIYYTGDNSTNHNVYIAPAMKFYGNPAGAGVLLLKGGFSNKGKHIFKRCTIRGGLNTAIYYQMKSSVIVDKTCSFETGSYIHPLTSKTDYLEKHYRYIVYDLSKFKKVVTNYGSHIKYGDIIYFDSTTWRRQPKHTAFINTSLVDLGQLSTIGANTEAESITITGKHKAFQLVRNASSDTKLNSFTFEGKFDGVVLGNPRAIVKRLKLTGEFNCTNYSKVEVDQNISLDAALNSTFVGAYNFKANNIKANISTEFIDHFPSLVELGQKAPNFNDCVQLEGNNIKVRNLTGSSSYARFSILRLKAEKAKVVKYEVKLTKNSIYKNKHVIDASAVKSFRSKKGVVKSGPGVTYRRVKH